MLFKNKMLIGSHALCIVVGVTLFIMGSRVAYLDLNDMKDNVDGLNLNIVTESQQASYKYDKLVIYLHDQLQFQGDASISNYTINDCPKAEYEQLNKTNTTLHFNPTEEIIKVYPQQSFEVGLASERKLNYKQSLLSLFTGIDAKQLKQLLNYKQFSKMNFRNFIKDIQTNQNLKTFAFINESYEQMFTEFYDPETNSTKAANTKNKNFVIHGETNVQYNINQHIQKEDYDVLIFSKSSETILIEESKESQLEEILDQKRVGLLSVMSQINNTSSNVLFIGLGWNACHQQLRLFSFNKNGFIHGQKLDGQNLEVDKIYGTISLAMNKLSMPQGLIAKNSHLFQIKQEYPNQKIELLYQIQDSYNTLLQQYKFFNKLVNLKSSSATKEEDMGLLKETLLKLNKLYINYSDEDKSKVVMNASPEDLLLIQDMQKEIEDQIKDYSQISLNYTIVGAQFIFFSIFICLSILMVNMKVQDSIQSKRLINLALEIPIYYEAIKFLFSRLLIPEFSLSYPEWFQKEVREQQFQLQDETFFSLLISLGILALLNSTTLFIQQQYKKIFYAAIAFNLFLGEAYLQRTVFLNSSLGENKEQLFILLIIAVRFLYELYSTMGESLFYLYFSTILFLLPFLRYFFEISFIFFQYVNAVNGLVLLYLNRAETNFEEKITISILSFSPFLNFFISKEECSNFFFAYSSHLTLFCLLFCFAAYLKILYLPSLFMIINLLNYELIMNLKMGESDYFGFSLNNVFITCLSLLGVSTVIFWSKAQQMHKKNFNDLTLSKMFSSEVQSNQSVLIASLFKYNIFGGISLLTVMFFIILQNASLNSISVDFLEDFLKGDHNNTYINFLESQAIYTCATLFSSILMLMLYKRTKRIEDFDSASKSQVYETEEIAENSATRKGFDIIMASEQKQLNNNSTLF